MSLPPIHPALVHLPIAFVILSFVTDVLAKITKRESLAQTAFWSLVAALIGGGITIAAGYWDMNHAALADQTHEFVDQHLIIGWVLAICLLVLTLWRWRIRQQARRVVTNPYVIGALLVLALTFFQGWYGGEMVYAHGAGVAAAGQGTEPAAKAQNRLVRVHDALQPLETAVGGIGGKSHAEHGHGEKPR